LPLPRRNRPPTAGRDHGWDTLEEHVDLAFARPLVRGRPGGRCRRVGELVRPKWRGTRPKVGSEHHGRSAGPRNSMSASARVRSDGRRASTAAGNCARGGCGPGRTNQREQAHSGPAASGSIGASGRIDGEHIGKTGARRLDRPFILRQRASRAQRRRRARRARRRRRQVSAVGHRATT